MIREDLVRDLQEAHNKLIEHRGNVTSYDSWVQILGDQNPSNTLPLGYDDWLFFFGKRP